MADADAIVEAIAPELQSGDVVAILSNGGFGGIYEKLPRKLEELRGVAADMSAAIGLYALSRLCFSLDAGAAGGAHCVSMDFHLGQA